MILLTESLRRKLPRIGSQEDVSDPMVVAKFFTPDSSWTWYVVEGEDRDDDFLFFGLVDGLEVELGYFALSELTSVRGRLGLPVERDRYFRSAPLSTIQENVTRSHERR